jgi:uncharacterized protein
MKALVIYHAGCPDGFAAAYVAWKALKDTHQVEFYPASYQEQPPPFEPGTAIFIVDFSYCKNMLAQMLQTSGPIVVLDHHKTAEAELSGADLVGLSITFDMSKSGAVLTWEHFFPDVPVPLMFLYVQDRDLWQWKLPNSQMVNAGLWRGTPRDFDAWQSLAVDWKINEAQAHDLLRSKGEAITVADSFWIEMMCKKPQKMVVEGHTVPAVNSPVLQSEIGHHLLQTNTAPFAVAWYMDEKGLVNYSLRARTGEFDVSQIAKVFGGGGHAAAAGFRHREILTIIS